MEAVPNTFLDMLAGYVIILFALAIYGYSLVRRFQKLRREESLMKELEKKKGNPHGTT